MLSTKNKTILEFYNKHKHLDFETMNIIFINLMENIMKDLANDVDSNKNNLLIKELTDKFNILDDNLNKSNEWQYEKLNALSEEICKENNSIMEKYLTNMREMIIANNSTTQKDILTKISENYEKFNNEFNSNSNIDSLLLEQKHSIKLELENIFNERNKEINNNIILLNDSNKNVINKLIDNEHKNKYCSSSKGKKGEEKLMPILTKEFPEAEIIDTHSIDHSGDFIIQHKNKPRILIDTKHYDSKNIPTGEVTKLMNDMEMQDCHGILISQKTGICRRTDTEIAIHNNKIIIFITQCEYDGYKIKTAVNTIEHLAETLNDLNKNIDSDSDDNSYESISCDFLSELNKDYQIFLRDRNEIIKNTKKQQKELVSSLNKLTLTSLEKLLKSKFANTQNFGTVCEYCQKICVNKRGLTTHFRKCPKKPSNIKKNECIRIETQQNKVVHMNA